MNNKLNEMMEDVKIELGTVERLVNDLYENKERIIKIVSKNEISKFELKLIKDAYIRTIDIYYTAIPTCNRALHEVTITKRFVENNEKELNCNVYEVWFKLEEQNRVIEKYLQNIEDTMNLLKFIVKSVGYNNRESKDNDKFDELKNEGRRTFM